MFGACFLFYFFMIFLVIQILFPIISAATIAQMTLILVQILKWVLILYLRIFLFYFLNILI